MSYSNKELLKRYKPGMIVIINSRPTSWSHVGSNSKLDLIPCIKMGFEDFPMKVKIKELEDWTEGSYVHVPMEAVDIKTKKLIGFNLTSLVQTDNIKKINNINNSFQNED